MKQFNEKKDKPIINMAQIRGAGKIRLIRLHGNRSVTLLGMIEFIGESV